MGKFKKIILAILAVLTAVELILVIYLYVPNFKHASPFLQSDRAYFVFGGTVDATGAEPRVVNGEVMLPFDTVRQFIDPRIWYDEKNNTVTVTTQDRILRMQTDKLGAMINGKPVDLSLPVRNIDGTIYVPITFLTDFYDITLNTVTYGLSETVPGTTVITADPASGTYTYAYALKKGVDVRQSGTIHAPIVEKFAAPGVTAADRMTVYGEKGDWYYMRTADGATGYVKKDQVRTESVVLKSSKTVEVKKPWTPADGKIDMTWEIVANANPDTGDIPDMPGLDVVSPTWFEMTSAGGELKNRAEKSYVDWAHGRGYKVWAALTNNFASPAMTHDFLTDSDAKDNLIRKTLAFAALYDLDGINIDFENIYVEDRDALTQFAREIAPLLREQGLTVSMDVNIPDGSDNWSLCYDHKGLGEAVDYLMLMAYEQFFPSGNEAGSVSQITWVESNVNKVLQLVPAAKLVLGVPLYTRLWKVVDGIDRNVGVLTMDNAFKRVADMGVTPVWDTASGQFYTEYVKDGVRYMLWIEDANSIALRAGLVQKYGLAGTAAWQREDGSDSIWKVFDDSLKKVKTYAQWLAARPAGTPVWTGAVE